MSSDKRKVDAATAFLEDHGEHMNGATLKVKCTATDLADSPSTLNGRNKSRGAGINLRKVAEVLEDYGLDPTEEIVKVLPVLDDNLKSKVLLELLSYVQPKLKAVEITGKDGGPIDAVTTLNVGFVGVSKS